MSSGSQIDLRPASTATGFPGLLWLGSIGTGYVLLAIKQVLPRLAAALLQAWMRVPILTSGCRFVANAIPPHLLGYIDWNPLFHLIDQVRDAVFVNDTPHTSDAVFVTVACLSAFFAGITAYAVAYRLLPHNQ